LVFKKNANFFAENWDHNIDPWSILNDSETIGSFFSGEGQKVRQEVEDVANAGEQYFFCVRRKKIVEKIATFCSYFIFVKFKFIR
jgi:hypothetical protein